MEHRLSSTGYRNGLWTWYCTCGRQGEAWTMPEIALRFWREHHAEAQTGWEAPRIGGYSGVGPAPEARPAPPQGRGGASARS